MKEFVTSPLFGAIGEALLAVAFLITILIGGVTGVTGVVHLVILMGSSFWAGFLLQVHLSERRSGSRR